MAPTESLLISERWLWLSGSLLGGLLVAWSYWLATRNDNPPRWLQDNFLIHSARLLYAIAIPAAALLWRGVLSSRLLGLKRLLLSNSPTPLEIQAHWNDWASDFGWLALLLAGVLMIYQLARWQTRAGTPIQRRRLQGGALLSALREALYHQAHWAFYREPWVLLWGAGLGTWAGLGLVGIQAALNPWRWRDLRQAQTRARLLARLAIALSSALLYLQTQNLWLAIALDAALGWLLEQPHTHHKRAGAP